MSKSGDLINIMTTTINLAIIIAVICVIYRFCRLFTSAEARREVVNRLKYEYIQHPEIGLKKNPVTAPTVYAADYGYKLGQKIGKEHPETAKALVSGILPPLGAYAHIKDFIKKLSKH